MKPLGIVLLFVNLLAAIGVVYLGAQSWAKRQDNNTALLKHELVASGLPLETPTALAGKPVDWSKPDETVSLDFPIPGRGTTEVRKKVLIDHFTTAGAKRDDNPLFASASKSPPVSVVAEVDDVYSQIKAKVAGFGNDPVAGLGFLVGGVGADFKLTPGLLTLLADDFEERVTYREWLTEAGNPQPVYPAAALWQLAQSALNAKFAEALDKENPATADAYHTAKQNARAARDKAYDEWQTAPITEVAAKKKAFDEARMAYWTAMTAKSAALSQGDRRRKAAGLLAVVDPSAGGQKRTALVVGMGDYTAAVLDRTQRLSVMPERFERQSGTELDNFVKVYEQKLATSRDLDRMLQRQTDITKSFAAQEKQAADEVATRTKHKEGAEGRVADLQKKVDAASAAQEALEKEVFALQQLAGARFAELFELEDEVYKAEKKKAGK